MSGIINSAGTRSGVIGIETNPSQPAFNATFGAVTNLPVGVNVYLAGSELFDVGSNLATNAQGTTLGTHGMIFTAPVTGKYQINLWLQLSDYADDMQYFRLNLNVGSLTYYSIHTNEVGDASPPSKYATISLSVLGHMDSGDICSPFLSQATGTVSLDVIGGQSVFSGYLVT